MENKGIFLYLDSINALDSLYSDSQKWRIVRSATMYAVLGELPDEKMQRNTAFLFLKSMVDNSRAGQKRRKVGGVCEEKTKGVNISNSEGSCGGAEEDSESDDKSLLGKEKLKTIKTKNENKTKNKTNKSSSGETPVGLAKECEKNEEEKEGGVRLVMKPTLGEVEKFVEVTKVKVDPLCFFEYHEAKNWMVGGRVVGDWRACVLEWDRRERRKELREKEREKKLRIRNYGEKDLDEINSSVVDLSEIKNIAEIFD